MDRKDLETIEGYDEDNDKYVLAYPQADADNVMDGYEERILLCCTTIKNLRARIKELETALATSREEHAHSVQELTRHIEAEKPKWISVNDRLPNEEDEGTEFLVTNGVLCVVCEWRGYWNNDPFCGDKVCDEVTHWMPFPPPPTEESTATEKDDK